MFQRRPVLLVAVLALAALVAGQFGGTTCGLWDGPI
jgi:hypothetical protein